LNQQANITCALVDIGGVLLSNDWDRYARKPAAEHFRWTLPNWMSAINFILKFMFSQSTLIPEMIELITYQQISFE